MDPGTLIFIGVIALLVLNGLLVHLPRWSERRGAFWSLQALNLGASCFMVVEGIPGLPGAARYANWVIALLLLIHLVQNNARLVAVRRAEEKARLVRESEELRAGRLPPGEGEDPPDPR